jgi:hypothetical protein
MKKILLIVLLTNIFATIQAASKKHETPQPEYISQILNTPTEEEALHRLYNVTFRNVAEDSEIRRKVLNYTNPGNTPSSLLTGALLKKRYELVQLLLHEGAVRDGAFKMAIDTKAPEQIITTLATREHTDIVGLTILDLGKKLPANELQPSFEDTALTLLLPLYTITQRNSEGMTMLERAALNCHVCLVKKILPLVNDPELIWATLKTIPSYRKSSATYNPNALPADFDAIENLLNEKLQSYPN